MANIEQYLEEFNDEVNAVLSDPNVFTDRIGDYDYLAIELGALAVSVYIKMRQLEDIGFVPQETEE